jgi:hypothetical protein
MNSLEKAVSANAMKLDKVIGKFSEHKGEYVVFNDGQHFFASEFEDAVTKGVSIYGEKTGFAIRKVGHVPVFSNLVVG